MLRGISDIATTLNMLLPPWAVATLIGVVLLVALPAWINSVRTKQIHGRTRRMVRADPEERSRLLEEILDIAGDRPSRLLAVVHNADKYGLRDVRNRALDLLEATGKAEEDVARLRMKAAPQRKPVGHVIEVALSIERMIEQGMLPAARVRLDEALQRYPEDPELRALQERL